MLVYNSQHNPSYGQGFVTRDQSMAPDLWKGCVGAWVPSLGPTGLTLFDQSGFQNHGTLTAIDPATGWVIGGNQRWPGYALNFDGGDVEYVSIPRKPNLFGMPQLTIVLWTQFKGDSARADEFTAVDAWKTGALHYLLRYNSNNNQWEFVTNTSSSVVTSFSEPATEDGGWHLITAIYDGAFNRLYFDGVANATTGAQTGAINSGGIIGVWIGNAQAKPTTDKYQGGISLVSIYDRALLPSEIQHLYDRPLDMFTPRPRVFPAAVAAPAGFTSRNIIVGGGVI